MKEKEGIIIHLVKIVTTEIKEILLLKKEEDAILALALESVSVMNQEEEALNSIMIS